MKIGISTGNFHDCRALRNDRVRHMEEGYRRMKAAGFDCADYGYLSITSGDLFTVVIEE